MNKKKYTVSVTRVSHSIMDFEVLAESEEEAIEMAKEEAFNTEFTEQTSDYLAEISENPTKYYRVFDHQRGVHFATGYNATSIKELTEAFRSYIEGGGESIEGNFETWDDIANHISEVTLEESETPFEEYETI